MKGTTAPSPMLGNSTTMGGTVSYWDMVVVVGTVQRSALKEPRTVKRGIQTL